MSHCALGESFAFFKYPFARDNVELYERLYAFADGVQALNPFFSPAFIASKDLNPGNKKNEFEQQRKQGQGHLDDVFTMRIRDHMDDVD